MRRRRIQGCNGTHRGAPLKYGLFLQGVTATVGQVHSARDDIQSDISDLRKEIRDLKAELATLRRNGDRS